MAHPINGIYNGPPPVTASTSSSVSVATSINNIPSGEPKSVSGQVPPGAVGGGKGEPCDDEDDSVTENGKHGCQLRTWSSGPNRKSHLPFMSRTQLPQRPSVWLCPKPPTRAARARRTSTMPTMIPSLALAAPRLAGEWPMIHAYEFHLGRRQASTGPSITRRGYAAAGQLPQRAG